MAISFCSQDQLASGGSDNAIRIWDLKLLREVNRLVGHTGSIVSLDCNYERRLLVSGSFDTTARVWRLDEPASGKSTLRGVERPPMRSRQAHDDRHVLAGIRIVKQAG